MPLPDRLLLLLAAALILPRPAEAFSFRSPQFPPDSVVQRIVDERVGAGGAVGLVVGLLELDGTTRLFHAGQAAAGGHALGTHALIPAGWIAEVLTGTLLADMARRGEVSPDDPMDRYWPEGALAGDAHGSITLADLARSQDSSLGVGLLGQLLASRLGMSWEDAVRQRVLEPLGMITTSLEPAGGAYSTTDDLLRFLAANVGLPRTGLQHAMRMAHHPRARLDNEQTVGLTWRVHDTGGVRTVWHGGRTGGQSAFLGFDPQRGIGVVVLASSGRGVDDLGLYLLNPAMLMGDPRAVFERYRVLSERAGTDLRPREEMVQRVADSLLESGNAPEAAFNLLRLNLWFYPGSYLATRRLADALAARGEWELAARHYERSLVLKPGDPAAMDGLRATRPGGR